MKKRTGPWFIFSGKGAEGVEIRTQLSAQYGDSALSQQSVYECIDMFTEGRTSATDSELLRCLSTVTRDDKHEHS